MEEKKKSSSLKKSKKRKHSDLLDIVEHEELTEHLKNSNICKKEKEINTINHNEVKERVDFPSCSDEHQNAGSQKEFDGDSWTKEDSLELIRRMDLQLPKLDTMSFSRRAEKLNWSQIQFNCHSEEECREKWKELRKNVRKYRILKEVLEDAKTHVESPWKATSKNKRARHPEQPTRPLSSYMLFYMDKKNKIVKKYPALKMTDITRLIGTQYKKLSEERKSYYIEKAKEKQEEYKKNLSKFYEKYPEYMKPSSKNAIGKTKKPCTAIKLYLQEKLLKHQHDENFNRHAFEEKYKELWKTLSSKKKAHWIRRASDEQDKYLEQQEDLSGDEDKPALPYKSIITKEENAILDRLAGKPEKPPTSAYTLFSRLMLQNKTDHIDGDPQTRMKEVGNMWRQLTDEQKKAYAEEVQHMNDLYKLEFANYLENLPKDKREEELAKVQPKKKSVTVKNKTSKETTNPKSKKLDILENEPEKPPLTAWDLYKSKYVKNNSHLPSEVAFKNAATSWKTLSPKEIEKYKKKYEKIKEKYMVDFEAFVKSLSEEELREYYLRSQSNEENDQNEEDPDNDQESSLSEEYKDDDGSESSSSESASDSGVSDEGWT